MKKLLFAVLAMICATVFTSCQEENITPSQEEMEAETEGGSKIDDGKDVD